MAAMCGGSNTMAKKKSSAPTCSMNSTPPELDDDLSEIDLRPFNWSGTSDFVRPEKVYRELLVAYVEKLSVREHPSPSVMSMQLNIDVLGKVMVINVDRTYR